MARKTKTESAQTRARILDAAEREMLARGVSRTTLESIARRANVSRGAIYWHFADKTALLEAMMQRTAVPLSELRESLGQQLGVTDPLRLLREMLLHSTSRLANDEQHRRVSHIVLHRCEMSGEDTPATLLICAMFKDSHDVLLSLCEDISKDHPLRPPLTCKDASDMILAFMVGLYECSLRHPETYVIRQGMENKINALLSGLFENTNLMD